MIRLLTLTLLLAACDEAALRARGGRGDRDVAGTPSTANTTTKPTKDDDPRPSTDDAPRSVDGSHRGTRLAPSGVVTQGLEAVLGMFDTELGVHCTFETRSYESIAAPDGGRHCLPVQTTSFADSACSTPVALITSCNAAPYRYVTVESGCGERTVYPVGEALANVKTIYARSPDGSCSELPVDPDWTVFSVRAPMPLARFVRAERKTEGDGRLQSFVYRGEDGSVFREPFVAFDRQLSVPCQPGKSDDGTQRCLPSLPAWENPNYRANASCTGAVAERPWACEASLPAFATAASVAYDASTCEHGGQTYHRVGAPLASVYSSLTCKLDTPRGVVRSFDDAVPASTFARLEPDFVSGEALGQTLYRGDGVTFRMFGYLDLTLDVPCLHLGAREGDLACVPRDPYQSSIVTMVYSDAACKAPLLKGDTTQCAKKPRYHASGEWIRGACFQRRAHNVGATLTPPSKFYYKANDGSCSGAVVPQAKDVFFALGAELPLASLPSVSYGLFE